MTSASSTMDTTAESAASANVAERLRDSARRAPDQPAVIVPARRFRAEQRITFIELDALCDRLAAGMIELGIAPGQRIVLMVRPGIEFIALTFALFRAGAVVVLIDPGMGLSRVARCLEETDPHGFAAIPIAQWLRRWWSKSFPHASLNISVGWDPLGDAASYKTLQRTDAANVQMPPVDAGDPAAIIFTSGGTGPPKGVVYEHRMFTAQADLLRERFDIQPGEVDLAGFPLFALFNAAMCVTTVLPAMDPTRPAMVNPRHILDPIRACRVTQAFGSPALWNRVGRYCEARGETIPHLKRAFSAGAPVPLHVLERMTRALTEPGAAFYTPYGATEALPVSVIDAATVLRETAPATRRGAGTCVGSPFPRVRVRIIPMTDAPIATIHYAPSLPAGEVGEIVVKSPSVTGAYFHRTRETALAKIADRDGFWHRMGDVGYFDEAGRLWFCGRKAHVVSTPDGPMYSVCCEAILNEHPHVHRSALVGVGEGQQKRPVGVVELEPGVSTLGEGGRSRLFGELRQLALANPLTRSIDRFLIHPGFPVDVRHNIKIDRPELARWAQRTLGDEGAAR